MSEIRKGMFDLHCKGCRPAIFESKTGKILPDNDPSMVAVLALWDAQPLSVKEAWHRVKCLNSTMPEDRKKAMDFIGIMVRAIATIRRP